ncbi:MAG: SIS domain-containing protein [Bacilli bacterium]|nr:SIS domain-containing protein [Bacilli bacterium]
MDFVKSIEEYYEKEMEVVRSLNKEELNAAMNCIMRHYEAGTNIYVLGNGGSSATASHMVCDFNKGICGELEKKFRVICLNDNIPMLMAVGNDISFENVFYEQMVGRINKDELVIAISGSGNSHNVIKAVNYAKEVGCEIIGMTGYAGGKLMGLSDYKMHVPVDDMQIVEDIHMSFDHMIMKIFWRYLMAKEGKEAIYKINQ